jgi:hypothetical protein
MLFENRESGLTVDDKFTRQRLLVSPSARTGKTVLVGRDCECSNALLMVRKGRHGLSSCQIPQTDSQELSSSE